MARVGRWIHSLLRPLPAQSDRAIADEIQSHVALHADELIEEYVIIPATKTFMVVLPLSPIASITVIV